MTDVEGPVPQTDWSDPSATENLDDPGAVTDVEGPVPQTDWSDPSATENLDDPGAVTDVEGPVPQTDWSDPSATENLDPAVSDFAVDDVEGPGSADRLERSERDRRPRRPVDPPVDSLGFQPRLPCVLVGDQRRIG